MDNKNIRSLPSSFEDIVYPEFESRLEVFEWILYQQKELLLLLRCHLNHGVRTRAFANHFEKTNRLVQNAVVFSFSDYEETEAGESRGKIKEIRYFTDLMERRCQQLRECPLI